jgi:hypothetical protein
MSTAAKRPRVSPVDPVTVDPTHYKVESENNRLRVLRVMYGPREKSVMHTQLPLQCFSPQIRRDSRFQAGRPKNAVGTPGRPCSFPRKRTCLETWTTNLSNWYSSSSNNLGCSRGPQRWRFGAESPSSFLN